MEKRRSDHIADALEEAIFDGEMPAGARLDEASLAEKFGVSRTPLREALQRLARSGLIEQIPRRGAFVRQPGPVELIEMFEVMAELEAVCGRLAASRISELALAELQTVHDACARAAQDGDPNGYYSQNEQFHQIIYRESGNEFLRAETAALHRRLQPFRRQQLRLRGRMAQSLAEHQAIIDALAQGAGDVAATNLRAHVAIQGEKFHSLVSGLRDAAHGTGTRDAAHGTGTRDAAQ